MIPYADNAYHDARPELSYAPEEVLHLDSQLGLNPAMKGPGRSVEQAQSGHRARRRLSEAGPQSLPVHGHLADRRSRRALATPGGSAAGSMSPEPIRCARSTSDRCCRPWRWAQNHRLGAGSARPLRSAPRRCSRAGRPGPARSGSTPPRTGLRVRRVTGGGYRPWRSGFRPERRPAREDRSRMRLPSQLADHSWSGSASRPGSRPGCTR